MDTVGAYEAKTQFSKLLERVARGESITISKHGVPVAVLQPVERPRKMSPSQAIDALMKMSEGLRLNGLSIREMIEEGRD